jgi:hypothetical protein
MKAELLERGGKLSLLLIYLEIFLMYRLFHHTFNNMRIPLILIFEKRDGFASTVKKSVQLKSV